jgi:hypothetical protein
MLVWYVASDEYRNKSLRRQGRRQAKVPPATKLQSFSFRISFSLSDDSQRQRKKPTNYDQCNHDNDLEHDEANQQIAADPADNSSDVVALLLRCRAGWRRYDGYRRCDGGACGDGSATAYAESAMRLESATTGGAEHC